MCKTRRFYPTPAGARTRCRTIRRPQKVMIRCGEKHFRKDVMILSICDQRHSETISWVCIRFVPQFSLEGRRPVTDKVRIDKSWMTMFCTASNINIQCFGFVDYFLVAHFRCVIEFVQNQGSQTPSGRPR